MTCNHTTTYRNLVNPVRTPSSDKTFSSCMGLGGKNPESSGNRMNVQSSTEVQELTVSAIARNRAKAALSSN